METISDEQIVESITRRISEEGKRQYATDGEFISWRLAHQTQASAWPSGQQGQGHPLSSSLRASGRLGSADYLLAVPQRRRVAIDYHRELLGDQPRGVVVGETCRTHRPGQTRSSLSFSLSFL